MIFNDSRASTPLIPPPISQMGSTTKKTSCFACFIRPFQWIGHMFRWAWEVLYSGYEVVSMTIAKLFGHHLPNFHKWSEGIYRGAQPNEPGFIKLRDEYGIKTVINLRNGYQESKQIEALGMKSIEIPCTATALPLKTVVQFLRLLNNESGPFFVHCYHGADRTGALLALHRMIIENVPREKAIEEMLDGFGFHVFRHPELLNYIKTVDLDQIKQALEN